MGRGNQEVGVRTRRTKARNQGQRRERHVARLHTSMHPEPPANGHLGALRLALSLAFGWLWLSTAWLSDDAFISLRHIDQLVHGNGLVFNPGERVVGFTHPLWVAILVPLFAITKSAIATLWLPAAIATAGALAVVLRAARTVEGTALVTVALLASRSFVDWSSSGLENPLSHLLVALLAVETLGRLRLSRIAVLAGLLGLAHPDLVVLAAPPLLLALRRSPPRGRVVRLLAGLSPLVLWHVALLLWTGSLVPNTALAKLPPNVGTGELAAQGLLYLLSSALWDPPTLAVIGLGIASAARSTARWALALGVVLHLAVVVRVGGDFMNGRFLTPVFIAALVLLATSGWAGRRGAVLAAIGAVALLALPNAHWLDRWRADSGRRIDVRGVADERAFYGPGTSLVLLSRGVPLPRKKFVRDVSAAAEPQSEGLVVGEAIGLLGFDSPPEVHIVDRNGLTDPFLARLPIDRGRPWRIGHFTRDVPAGYLAAIEQPGLPLDDPCLDRIHRDVVSATRGPLLDGPRFGAIWRLQRLRWAGPRAVYGESCAAVAASWDPPH